MFEHHKTHIRHTYCIMAPEGYTDSLWTCHSRGNLVDDLPPAVHPKFRWKVLNYPNIDRAGKKCPDILYLRFFHLLKLRKKLVREPEGLATDHSIVFFIFPKMFNIFVGTLRSPKAPKKYARMDIEKPVTAQAASRTQKVNIGQYTSLLDVWLERKPAWQFIARHTCGVRSS